jgi:homoserine/homoserine lactone efflux protein
MPQPHAFRCRAGRRRSATKPVLARRRHLGIQPKTLLFFPSFFPQFISAPSNEAHWSANQQYLLLAATFACVFALGVASTAIFSHRLRTVLQRPKRLRAVNRLMGSVLVGMGALMAAVR